ncbi:MAG: FecR domain-containing protein [Steroidobacteraceae bacterium]|nr:FecR domain-containing protein [Steroidobacteraceae bacterium]
MKLRPLLLLLALAAPALAWAAASPAPERIARLTYVEGEAEFQAAHKRPTTTLPKRPLEPGDRIATRPEARAELALGTATIRLDEHTDLAILDLDETTIRVELTAGTASLYLDQLPENETFEIVTPNAAIAFREPGEYRVDVHDGDLSVLTVHTGSAEVATAAGPLRVAAGQRVRLDGDAAFAQLETPLQADEFDDWVLERELRLAEAQPPRYTPYQGDRYDDLDRYGEWYDEPRYGRVWMPGYDYYGWSPYGGYWQRSGYGWSWYDPAPWGYFSYYSGRWMYLRDRNRWVWLPAPQHRPRHPRPDDDRPQWYPRARGTPESAPRTADRGSNAGNAPAPVTLAPSAPRRVDPDRRPAPARENASNERPRGGTYAPRGNREPVAAPPQRSEPAPRPSSPPPVRERSNPEPAPRISNEPVTRQEP